MECAIESTPHEETCIYTSVLEGGNLMQKFKDDGSQDEADIGDGQREHGCPIRATGEYAPVQNPWPRDEEREAREITGVTKRSHVLIDDKGIDGTNMESHHLLLPQRRTSRVIMSIRSRHGDHLSLHIVISGQLSPTDFKRPTGVMANGPDGLVTSDSRSRTNGVSLLSVSRLPAMTALGRKCQIRKDHN